MQNDASLAKALALHTSVALDLVARAERIPESAWFTPIDEGKWSPAELLAHLVCTYDVVLRELRGGSGMAIRTKLWQRLLLRLTVLPGMMAGRGFPKGAIAPRETRPQGTSNQAESVALFRARANELDTTVRSAPGSRRLTHAYFGSAKLADGVTLCARHIEHHAAQLVR